MGYDFLFNNGKVPLFEFNKRDYSFIYSLSLRRSLSLSPTLSLSLSGTLSLSLALSLSLSGTLAHSPLLSIRYEIPNFHFNIRYFNWFGIDCRSKCILIRYFSCLIIWRLLSISYDEKLIFGNSNLMDIENLSIEVCIFESVK